MTTAGATRSLIEKERMMATSNENRSARAIRILLVEDDQDALDFLSEVLGCAGHDVHSAETADDALTQLHAFEPDLAIIDIGLPDLDGYELARRFRERSKCCLFALSGFSARTAPRDTTVSSFDAHFTKPVDISALLGAFVDRRPA
jgi:DNA-binding response OmpR family regulator